MGTMTFREEQLKSDILKAIDDYFQLAGLSEPVETLMSLLTSYLEKSETLLLDVQHEAFNTHNLITFLCEIFELKQRLNQISKSE